MLGEMIKFGCKLILGVASERFSLFLLNKGEGRGLSLIKSGSSFLLFVIFSSFFRPAKTISISF